MTKVIYNPRFVNTWQDAENIDVGYPYTAYIWIPTQLRGIRQMLVHLYVEKYRKCSDITASRDLGTKTSVAEGEHRHQMFDYMGPGGVPGLNRSLRFKNSLGGNVTTNWTTDASTNIYTFGTESSHAHDVVLGSHTHATHSGIDEDAVLATANVSCILYDPSDNIEHNFGIVQTGEGDVELDLTTYFRPINERGLWYLVFSIDADEARLRLMFMQEGIY